MEKDEPDPSDPCSDIGGMASIEMMGLVLSTALQIYCAKTVSVEEAIKDARMLIRLSE